MPYQRVGELTEAATIGSAAIDHWLERVCATTGLSIPEFGLSVSAPDVLAKARTAVPDLRGHVRNTFIDRDRNRFIYQVELSGTLAKDLGSLGANGKSFKGIPAFVIVDAGVDDRVKTLTLRVEPGLALHLLGFLPDPRAKAGRLSIIAKRSILSAARVAMGALWSRARKLLEKTPAIPATAFVPAPSITTPIEAVRRHFDAERKGDVKATLETMSDRGIGKYLVGTNELHESRDALSRHYDEVFAAFKGGVFTPTYLAEGEGGKVYVEYRFTGRHTGELGGVPATGRYIEYDAQMIFDVAPDMSIQRETTFAGVLTVLAALGLADDPATKAGLARLLR